MKLHKPVLKLHKTVLKLHKTVLKLHKPVLKPGFQEWGYAVLWISIFLLFSFFIFSIFVESLESKLKNGKTFNETLLNFGVCSLCDYCTQINWSFQRCIIKCIFLIICYSISRLRGHLSYITDLASSSTTVILVS